MRPTIWLEIIVRPNCEEDSVITYDRHRSQFVIYCENASQDKNLAYPSGPRPLTSGNLKQTVSYAIEDNQALNLDVFVDKSVIEIFVNGDICIVQRVYPMRDDRKQVRQFTNDRQIRARNVVKWEMDATNPW